MRAASQTGAARPAPDTSLLAALWDPMRCPVQALPHLASAVGCSVWNPEWPEGLKRRVIARTIVLKRRVGAYNTFVEYLSFLDAELVNLRAAPQIAAPIRRTAAQRQAWASQFPELRVYAVRQTHTRTGGAMVPGRAWGGARRFARSTGVTGFVGRHATITRAGQESQITSSIESDGSCQVRLPTVEVRWVPGRPLARTFPRPSLAADRIYTYLPGDAQLDTLPPSPVALNITPARVAQAAARKSVMVPGRPLFGRSPRFLRPTRAAERCYDSLRLFDRGMARAGKVTPRGGWICGKQALGKAAFTIGLDVDLSRQKPGGRSAFPRLPGFTRPHDGSRTSEAIQAVRAAKLGRDKVTMRTGLSGPITVDQAISLGDGYRVGQIIRSV